MYKVLLVDDEYMITEGLKRLIPFDKWDMEVVATANHADDALDYVREHPVDIVISDVNMPDKTGLEMIGEMKELLPNAYYILLSGYQEFDYVKKAMNLNVVDYLVKPVDKVELERLLEKIASQLGEKSHEPEILSQQLDEEAFKAHLSQKENWWIGLSKEKQGNFVIPYYVLGQDWQIILADQEFEGLLVMPFEAPYQANFEKWKRDVEKTLFYGSVNLDQSESLFSYYEPIYRVIIQGNLQQIIEELTLLEKIVLENTPRVSITKQLFTQFVMDVFHLFEHLKADDMTDGVQVTQGAPLYLSNSIVRAKEFRSISGAVYLLKDSELNADTMNLSIGERIRISYGADGAETHEEIAVTRGNTFSLWDSSVNGINISFRTGGAGIWGSSALEAEGKITPMFEPSKKKNTKYSLTRADGSSPKLLCGENSTAWQKSGGVDGFELAYKEAIPPVVPVES